MPGKINTLILNSKHLYYVKTQLNINLNTPYFIAMENLIYNANKALRSGPFSVIYKENLAPSGSKHDYLSIAPYWWPDTTKANGLPYIRKDGVFNPEGYTDKYDKRSLLLLRDAVSALSLGYYLTDNEQYASYCAELIRTWFINPETRMNPNMNYAQGVPGIVNGRKEGVLETERLLTVLDGIKLISTSKYWTDNDNNAFNNWLSEYISWLETSELALAERATDNNHGTWYDAQYVSYLVYLGQYSKASSYLQSKTIPRIESQIMPDGKMPKELNRTRPIHYTLYNLEPFTILAILGEKLGIDIWNYESPAGSSLNKAYSFIAPYIMGKHSPYVDIESDAPAVVGNSRPGFARYFREASVKYNNISFSKAADMLLGDEIYSHIANLVSTEYINARIRAKGIY